MRTGAVIVAAGRSSRMGDFKPMLNVGTVSMARRVVAALREAGAETLVMVTGNNAEALEQHLEGEGLVFLRNSRFASTQMFDSAKIGFEYLQGKCDRILFTPVDIPLFTAESAAALLRSGAPLACPICNGETGHPLLISSELVPQLLSDGGDGGLRGAIRRLGIPMQEIPVRDPGVLLDADTPQDYESLVNYHNAAVNSRAGAPMMFRWQPDMVRFMRDASEYGSYYRELSRAILPYLGNGHICDAGCGLGYLSLELAKTAGKVTAVDIHPDALSVLRENCEKRGAANIETVCGDVFSLRPAEKYSAMVFCHFGDIDTILRHADSLCSGPVCIIKRNDDKHGFSPDSFRNKAAGHEAACRRLDDLGIAYRSFELECELGQPFRSMEDARLFFELYRQDNSAKLTDSLLRERLIHTGREDFPLYLPYVKKAGCIVLDPSGIPPEQRK